MAKPRIAKDYDKISEELLAKIKVEYPDGFENHLVNFTDAKGQKVSALPYEDEEAYYLIKMTKLEAKRIIEEDEDYTDGHLRDDFGDEIEGEDAADAEGDDEEEDNYGDDPADAQRDDDDDDER